MIPLSNASAGVLIKVCDIYGNCGRVHKLSFSSVSTCDRMTEGQASNQYWWQDKCVTFGATWLLLWGLGLEGGICLQTPAGTAPSPVWNVCTSFLLSANAKVLNFWTKIRPLNLTNGQTAILKDWPFLSYLSLNTENWGEKTTKHERDGTRRWRGRRGPDPKIWEGPGA